MHTSRGLVIASPWIDFILDGQKTWDMRSTSTSHRGWFGLIRKGSGQIFGVAKLVECGAPMSKNEMIATFDRHRIPERLILSGTVDKWIVPWKLEEVRVFFKPIPYTHKSGAVTWVNLDQEVQASLTRQFPEARVVSHDLQHDRETDATWISPTPSSIAISQTTPPSALKSNSKKPAEPAPVLTAEPDTFIGKSVLSGGNIRNNHFKLTAFLDRFPEDSIGGSNKASRAAKQLVIDWGGASPAHTDIDGIKKLFRSRSWVRNFFEATRAKAGDTVIIEQSGPYSYRVRLEEQTTQLDRM